MKFSPSTATLVVATVMIPVSLPASAGLPSDEETDAPLIVQMSRNG
ncbi:MAG: hypothetical protein ACR2KT_03065 [Methylocella sp.]